MKHNKAAECAKQMGETILKSAMELKNIATKEEYYSLLENAVRHLKWAREMRREIRREICFS